MEKEVYKALIQFDFSQKSALCSLLQWKGSVPRKDYPLMLVLENGESVGTIGGGNIEYTVIEKAKIVIQTNHAILENFDLTNLTSNSSGSICGGTTQILIEPYTQGIQHFWKSLHYLENRRNDIIIITEVQKRNPISSQRYVVYPGTSTEFLSKSIADVVNKVQLKCRSVSIETDRELVLVQYVFPRNCLYIFGAGHIAKAVAELAYFIDLDVCIYDDRKNLANSTRFPHAKFINNSPLPSLVGQIHFYPNDFALIVTRSHSQDLELLRWLLTLDISYLGLMSSHRKWKILSETLLNEGFSLEQIQAVHAPVGIEIKAETAYEIAVSIISEIIYFYRRKK